MPKVIDNLRERLLDETRRVLLEEGYGAVTIRGVAKVCGTATGTVYNYFKSKDELIASAILGDWLEHVERARTSIAACADLRAGFSAILACIAGFRARYTATFHQSGVSLAGPAYDLRHHMLRDQIIELIRLLEQRFSCTPSATAEKVMAESLLSGGSHSWPSDELLPVLEKLIS